MNSTSERFLSDSGPSQFERVFDTYIGGSDKVQGTLEWESATLAIVRLFGKKEIEVERVVGDLDLMIKHTRGKQEMPWIDVTSDKVAEIEIYTNVSWQPE